MNINQKRMLSFSLSIPTSKIYSKESMPTIQGFLTLGNQADDYPFINNSFINIYALN